MFSTIVRLFLAPTWKEWTRLFVGLTLCGFGTSLIVRAQLGSSPWDVFHQGLSLSTHISVGQAHILTAFAVLILWLPLRQKPGLGTVANSIWLGLSLDFSMDHLVTTTPEALPLKALYLAFGTVVFGFGCALYLSAHMGPGPRDGLMLGLWKRFGVRISWVRTGIELAALTGGVLMHAALGWGTLFYALTIGFFVQTFKAYSDKRWPAPSALSLNPRPVGADAERSEEGAHPAA